MLELLFQGLIEWLYGLVLECWEYFSSVLFDLMRLDFAYLREHIPIIDTIRQIMLGVGWALLIGNLVFQATRGMAAGLGFEAEDPKLLFTRTFVFSFLLVVSPQICDLCLGMTSTVIELLQMPDAVDITFADEASFGGLAGAWLLVVICGIIVMFQTFRLIMEMAERYFILAVLTITSPLAFGMGGSRNTSDIFTGWCRMFGSMCLLMATNVMFVKMLLSVLSYYPSGLDVLPWMVLVITIVKVAKKADSILSRIGLNPAMTGDPLGRSFPGAMTMMVVRSLASSVAHTARKNGTSPCGSAGGSTPNTPNTPTGPRTTGPTGANRGGSVFASASTQSSANTQSSAQQGTAQETSTSQGTIVLSSVQTGSPQAVPEAPRNGTAMPPGGIQQGSTRKSAVPPGTRRAPAHVPAMTAKGNAAAAVKNAAQNATYHQAAASVMGGNSSQEFRQEQSVKTNMQAQGSIHAPGQNTSHATANTQSKQAMFGAAGNAEAANPPRSTVQPVGSAGSQMHTEKTQRANTNSSQQRSTGVPPSGIAETLTTPIKDVKSPSTPRSGMEGNMPTPSHGIQSVSAPIGAAGTQPIPHPAEVARSAPDRDTAGSGTRLSQAGDSQNVPQSSTAGTQRTSIGGRYTQPVQQTMCVSASGNTQITQQNHESAQQTGGSAPQSGTAHADARSTNRERPTSTAPVSPASPVPNRKTAATPRSTAQPDTVHPTEQRTAQRPIPPQNGNAEKPAPQAVTQTPAVPAASERQSRNPAVSTPVSRTTASASAVQEQNRQQKSPSAAQEHKAAKPATPQRNEQTLYHRHGAAGIAPTTVPINSEAAAQTPITEKSTKKPFIPLSGKTPESIPSHLTLREEAQKSTKRPQVGSPEVTEDG